MNRPLINDIGPIESAQKQITKLTLFAKAILIDIAWFIAFINSAEYAALSAFSCVDRKLINEDYPPVSIFRAVDHPPCILESCPYGLFRQLRFLGRDPTFDSLFRKIVSNCLPANYGKVLEVRL